MQVLQRLTALSTRWNALFRDHEIFVRTGGDVRFIRLSAQVQRRVATVVSLALGAWLIFTIGMLAYQAATAWQRQDVAARAAIVERAEARVARESGRIEHIAERLDARQKYLEGVVTQHLGVEVEADAKAAGDAAAAAARATSPTLPADADKISVLRAIGQRQEQLAVAMTAAITERSARAESALRAVGIRPGSTANQGGPFIPANRDGLLPPREPLFQRLDAAIDRMEFLENLVLSLPSTIPAAGMNLSSGFGYRRDPFTGAGAMHAGLDFKGPHGSPIYSAAAGTISFAGRKAGYGNVVEVDHGHGIITRYAHLSGFAARAGQRVAPGQLIARMGSTGRSTGTHLHFEVRVNGTAVNPRRFLESNSDVLEVQADAGERVRTRAGAR
ncbi:M23 family metallopeptidase [Sphingomonas lacunae]|uniref:M23 family metallopeptidase n=1 Tax=Sphingomonas lacunae TaxID=2698828 RepID=A0A6M4AWA2_9SPHN|nr:M23 family metallopeptidase [Sphingomonas lacunae]QJQ33413.1 M23 family metallopeptidase [Sphingomonas lacunae]